MKKNNFIILLLLIVCISTFAQSQFTVTYSRTKANWGIDDIQVLKYKEGVSSFEFYQKKETVKTDFYETKLGFKKFISNYNINSKEIIEQNELENGTLLLAQWKQNIEWKILDETKIVNGYTVQKATTQSYNYPKDSSSNFGIATAWFTTEIPVSIGPYRYHGLPGLILELSFERYGATYKATNIDFDTPVVIPEIKKGIKVSKIQSIHPYDIDKKWLRQQANGKENQSDDKKPWWQIWN